MQHTFMPPSHHPSTTIPLLWARRTENRTRRLTTTIEGAMNANYNESWREHSSTCAGLDCMPRVPRAYKISIHHRRTCCRRLATPPTPSPTAAVAAITAPRRARHLRHHYLRHLHNPPPLPPPTLPSPSWISHHRCSTRHRFLNRRRHH